MNRRHFLGACISGAPLIAIPTAALAHGPSARTTGMRAGHEWPMEIITVPVIQHDGGTFQTYKHYLVPSWGEKK